MSPPLKGGKLMAINDQVKFTWIGHGTWKVRTARGKDMLIDP